MWGVPGATAAGLISYLFQSCANNTAQTNTQTIVKNFQGGHQAKAVCTRVNKSLQTFA